MKNCDELLSTDKTECQVREYFESRGWSVEKLDLGGVRAADFQICKDDICFLCEVKTVESVHANLPWAPSLDVYETERKERQSANERWIKENPGSRLVSNSTDYEFVYGDQDTFRQKYGGRARFTEKNFKKFATEITNHFARSPTVQHLPFTVRLDSNDLYTPYGDEKEQFIEWLENELIAIASRKPIDYRWRVEKLPNSPTFHLDMFYPIHHSTRENDVNATYQMSITVPNYSDKLEVHISSYGQLNLDAITRNVESGLRQQLEATASREGFQGKPQVIVLAFAGGLAFEWGALWPHLSLLLQQNESLNAIAVLDRVKEGEPPEQQGGIEAFFSWLGSNQPWETRFIVVHNTWHPNEYRAMVARAFDYHKNGHIDSHTIEIPQSWLREEGA